MFRSRRGSEARVATTGGVGVRESRGGKASASDIAAERGEFVSHTSE